MADTPPHLSLELGDHNIDVLRVQRLLNGGNRWGFDTLSTQPSGGFGPHTVAAVRRAKFLLGFPGPQFTGVVGDALVSYLAQPTSPRVKPLPADYRARRIERMAAEARRLRNPRRLAVAQTQLGYTESPTNITKYGAWYNKNGVAWCAEFASWCDAQAGGNFHYAYTPYVVADARAGRNGLRVTNSPVPGDFVLYDWPGESPGTADHIGIFEHGTADAFTAIEGNTSPADWSNGGMVMRRERTRSLVIAFVTTL